MICFKIFQGDTLLPSPSNHQAHILIRGICHFQCMRFIADLSDLDIYKVDRLVDLDNQMTWTTT